MLDVVSSVVKLGELGEVEPGAPTNCGPAPGLDFEFWSSPDRRIYNPGNCLRRPGPDLPIGSLGASRGLAREGRFLESATAWDQDFKE
jgi:hypothetical protein